VATRASALGRCGRAVRAAIAAFASAGCVGPEPDRIDIHPEALLGDRPVASCPGPRPIEIVSADVAIVIDRSASTREPTGIDVDGDGQIGRYTASDYTDRDDSLLAAELAAVEALIEVTRLGGMRFAIVSYSGRDDFPLDDPVTQRVRREDARLEADLTEDPAQLGRALERVAQRGSDGASSFSPAMRLAVRTLRASGEADPARLRRVLFLADSPTPVRYAPMQRIARDDSRMEVEAIRAIEAGISFHSFGIGPGMNGEPSHALAQIAGATGGSYRSVPDPRQLYCEMLAALGKPEPI
jgi:hypothetical protein